MEELLLRPGTASDLGQVAEVLVASRRAAYPAMPPFVHPEAEVRAGVAGWDLSAVGLWVAERDGAVVGFAALTSTWLDHLYVDPRHAGQGIGSALLGLAQSLRPAGIGLWVFVSNLGARRFYERHGFTEVRRTDGTENEEGEPDIELQWRGRMGT